MSAFTSWTSHSQRGIQHGRRRRTRTPIPTLMFIGISLGRTPGRERAALALPLRHPPTLSASHLSSGTLRLGCCLKPLFSSCGKRSSDADRKLWDRILVRQPMLPHAIPKTFEHTISAIYRVPGCSAFDEHVIAIFHLCTQRFGNLVHRPCQVSTSIAA